MEGEGPLPLAAQVVPVLLRCFMLKRKLLQLLKPAQTARKIEDK